MVVDLSGIAASAAALLFGVGLKVARDEILAHVHNRILEDMLYDLVSAATGAMAHAAQDEIAVASVLHPNLNPLVAVGVRFALGHASAKLGTLDANDLARRIEMYIAHHVEGKLVTTADLNNAEFARHEVDPAVAVAPQP